MAMTEGKCALLLQPTKKPSKIQTATRGEIQGTIKMEIHFISSRSPIQEAKHERNKN
jgi:hypothetical protein